MSDPDFIPLEGGCSCKAIRYRMETAPLTVHCCQCRRRHYVPLLSGGCVKR